MFCKCCLCNLHKVAKNCRVVNCTILQRAKRQNITLNENEKICGKCYLSLFTKQKPFNQTNFSDVAGSLGTGTNIEETLSQGLLFLFSINYILHAF